jgi:AcrR family transcriptional regulator
MNRGSHRDPAVQPLRQKFKQATREAILGAAEGIFSDRGFNAARMEEIAERAGVAVGTLYNYFDDRRAILDAVLDASAQELSTAMSSGLPPHSAPIARQLEGFFRITVAHVEKHFRLYAILIEEELESGRGAGRQKKRPPVLRAVYDIAQEFVRRGVDRGELRPEDAPIYPALLMGMMRGIFMRQLCIDDRLPLSAHVEGMVRFFLHGAAAGAARREP